MRQSLIIALVVLSSYCGLTTARCLTTTMVGRIYDACIESASAKASTNENLRMKIINATTSVCEFADCKYTIAEYVAQCNYDNIVKYELRRMCVATEIIKICPSYFQDRKKRSTYPDLNLIIYSATSFSSPIHT